MVNSYNNILIKNFGNLFQRLLKITKPIQTKINEWITKNNFIIESRKKNYELEIKEKFLTSYDFDEYLRILNNLITELNKTLSNKKPWSIPDECEQIDVMGHLLLDYNICMCLMFAIIPSKIIELRRLSIVHSAKKFDSALIFCSPSLNMEFIYRVFGWLFLVSFNMVISMACLKN